jgi:aminomethyltransferase
MKPDSLSAYHQTVAGCGLISLPDQARLWATGRDRIDLIHRMSTNDLREMAANEGRATVLTTANARMIDRIIVINLADRALILGSAGTADMIGRWLTGYIFYNDDVAFTNASQTLDQFLLFGPQAIKLAETIWPGAADLKRYGVLEQDGLVIGRGEDLVGGSVFVIGSPDVIQVGRRAAVAAGAVVVDREVYEVARVESGLPEYGHELGESYIPLEAGLWNDISFSKGCYIGQEIIARMESRGKLAKTLVGVRAERPLTAGATFPGGTVTSVAQSPRFGWIGLAFVKPTEAEPGQLLEIEDVAARVAALPFQD